MLQTVYSWSKERRTFKFPHHIMSKRMSRWLHWFKTSMNSPSQKAWNPHLQTSHWISFCRAERRSMYSETIYRNRRAENPVWHQKQRKKHNIRHHLHFRFSCERLSCEFACLAPCERAPGDETTWCYPVTLQHVITCNPNPSPHSSSGALCCRGR